MGVIISLIFIGQTLGALIGLVRKPGKVFLYGSLAFAASMMISISFLQLIPEGLRIAPLSLIVVSFFLGVLVMSGVDWLLPHINPELAKKEKPSVRRSVAMLVIGIALHNLPEGLAIGVGFAVEWRLGIMVALGIAAQDVPENIATIIPLYGVTKKRLKSFIILTTTILFELVGFISGYYWLREGSLALLGACLALAAGFMVYISIEELLPAAEIRKYPGVAVTAIALGVVCTLMTGLIR